MFLFRSNDTIKIGNSNGNELSSTSRDCEEQRTPGNAAQCLSRLYLSEHLSDINILFPKDRSVILPAHSFVLRMRSKVFRDLLSPGQNTIHIRNVKPEVMKVVLRFIYSDDPEINSSNVFPCWKAAELFALWGLVERCRHFLEDRTDVSNVWQHYNFAISNKIKPLEEKCLTFIMGNATNVLFQPGFLNLSLATLLNVLKQDELAADEVDIFKAAMKWAEQKCESNNRPKTGENMRDQLKEETLIEIRFAIMSIQEFVEVVDPSEILTKVEMAMFYKYHATKNPEALEERFRKHERRKPITIDLRQYDLSELDHSNNQNKYVLEIECEFYDMAYDESGLSGDQDELIRNSKSLKLKSISGMFVKSVREIVVSNTYVNDYEVDGNYINFQTPIEMCNGEIIQFTTDKHDTAKNLNGTSPMRFNIDQNGNVFTLVQFPAMTETITFLK